MLCSETVPDIQVDIFPAELYIIVSLILNQMLSLLQPPRFLQTNLNIGY
jgi:hypothetical protein